MNDQTPPAGNGWKRREMTGTEVHITSPDGATTETINVLYDPDNPPTEEELKQIAWQMYHDAKRIRDNITPEETETLAEDLKTGEYGKWFVRGLRDALSSATIAATPGEDDTPTEIAETEETVAEFNAIMRDKSDSLLAAFFEDSSFWRSVAHDALTHAYAWALEDLRKDRPDLHVLPDAEFSAAWNTRYQEGGYLTEAILNIMPRWTEKLTKGIATGLEDADGGLGPLAEMIEQKARERVRTRRRALLPMMAPAFQNGWGRASSVPLIHGSLPLMMTPWDGDRRNWPDSVYQWQGGKSYFRLSFHENPTGGTEKQRAAAWELAENLTPWVGYVAFAIAMLYQRNKRHGGRVIADTREILRTLGRSRPGKGFRAGDKQHVNTALYTLSQLVIQDIRYLHKQSRKHKAEPRTAPTRHWLAYDILEQSGDDITFDIWLGEPLLQMVSDFPEQAAHILEGSISPDGRSPYTAAWALLLPLKAKEQRATFTQHGLPIRDLLIIGGIDPDRIDPRKRTWWKHNLPKDLDTLACLEAWEPKTPLSRKWEEWLADRLFLHIKREHAGGSSEEIEEEEKPHPESGPRIAAGWLT